MEMNVSLKRRLKVPEFLEWAETRSAGRYELVDGLIVGMAPERAAHNLAKMVAWRVLADAVQRSGLTCTAYGDGMTVIIDESTAREPDALVQCGKPIDADSMVADQPIIVVEVLSPSSERADTGEKLAEYFSLQTVRHYLIVNPLRHLVIHHVRTDAGRIETAIVASGEIELVPPGIRFAVTELFGPSPAGSPEAVG
jgi:Uma2 family endonuclease